MIINDGYSLMYDKKYNRIIIGIPPTIETATDTATPIADRRTDVSEMDLIVLLSTTQLIFHKGLRKDEVEDGH